MKEMSVLTCKNNHLLISRATILLTMSLILLASTFIVTPSLFAQSASSASTNFTEVDPTLIGCTEQQQTTHTHTVKSVIFPKGTKVPFLTLKNLSGNNCKAQWNPAANIAKKGCNFLTYYPPTNPRYHLMSDPTLAFWFQFNSFGGNNKNIPLQLLPNQSTLSSALLYDLQSITFQLSTLQDNQKTTLSLAPFYFQCTGQNSSDVSSQLNGTTQTNSEGYTFKFAITGIRQDPDGWCNTMPDNKTYLCTLNFNEKIVLSQNGDGSSMTNGSSHPLADGELPYCWPSWFPNPPSKAAPYTYYCGFFKPELQNVVSVRKTNSQGYTFLFTLVDPSKNQDGWCNPTQVAKTYLCTLEAGNQNNINVSENGDGSSMTSGSPQPLFNGQHPYCWPSWYSGPPNPAGNPNPQPHTAGQYSYSCGFFKGMG